MQAQIIEQSLKTQAWEMLKVGWSNLGKLTKYLFSLRWVVDLVRWLVATGGNIAESAFLLATLYVTIEVVAHTLVSWILPDKGVSFLNQIAVVAFTILPELIIFQAIKITFDHWMMAYRTRRIDTVAWAIAFTIPTIVFLIMTIITICSFVSLEAISKETFQATGWALVTRCLAGWWYGMASMLFDELGKSGYSQVFDALRNEILERDQAISKLDTSLNELSAKIAEQATKITDLERQLLEARMVSATRHISRKGATAESATAIPESAIAVSKSNTTDNDTVTTEKQKAIKEALRKNVRSGAKVNLKRVSIDAKVSYGLVRKHADTMIEEIRRETLKAV